MGAGEGAVHHLGVHLGAAGRAGIDAVDREMDEDFGEGAADGGEGIVAGGKVVAGDAVQGGCGGAEFACQIVAEDLAAGGFFLFLETAGPAGQAGPEMGERGFAIGVMQEGGDLVHEIVAGGAVGLPIGGQALARGENFLDHDVGWTLGGVRRPAGAGGFHRAAEFAGIAARVGQTVDMVDADAVDQALGVHV
jgi:hypothetical protein